MKSHFAQFTLAGFFFFAGLGHYTCAGIALDEPSSGNAPALIEPSCVVYLKTLLPPQGPFPTIGACVQAESAVSQSSRELVVYMPCESDSAGMTE